MIYSDDINRVFHREEGLSHPSEINLYGRSLAVIAGHKGLALVTPEEVVVRLGKGRVRFSGTGLKVEKASPFEIFLRGEISSVEFPPDAAGGGNV